MTAVAASSSDATVERRILPIRFSIKQQSQSPQRRSLPWLDLFFDEVGADDVEKELYFYRGFDRMRKSPKWSYRT